MFHVVPYHPKYILCIKNNTQENIPNNFKDVNLKAASVILSDVYVPQKTIHQVATPGIIRELNNSLRVNDGHASCIEFVAFMQKFIKCAEFLAQLA